MSNSPKSNIQVYYCIMTHSDQPYILSANKNKIVLPWCYVANPKILYDEIRVHIKNMFHSKSTLIDFLDNVQISFLDLQNYILLDHVEAEQQDYDYKEEDIILLCGTILYIKTPCINSYWIPLKHDIQYSNQDNKPIDRIIKYVLSKLIL